MTKVKGIAARHCEGNAIQEILAAVAMVATAELLPDGDQLVEANTYLRETIRSGNDNGLSWQTIGDTLGIRRGNAYQRYRRKPEAHTKPVKVPLALRTTAHNSRSASRTHHAQETSGALKVASNRQDAPSSTPAASPVQSYTNASSDVQRRHGGRGGRW
jgi:hypothetical protein